MVLEGLDMFLVLSVLVSLAHLHGRFPFLFPYENPHGIPSVISPRASYTGSPSLARDFIIRLPKYSRLFPEVCQAVYDDEPPAPEGVPYNNYSRIYSFLSSRRRGQTSNRVRKGYIVSNVTFTVLSISAVESNPSYLKTEIMIEEVRHE